MPRFAPSDPTLTPDHAADWASSPTEKLALAIARWLAEVDRQTVADVDAHDQKLVTPLTLARAAFDVIT